MAEKRKNMGSVKGSLSVTHPELAAEWHPTKNGDSTPSDETAGKDKKAWWQCPKCSSDYEASIGNRARGSGCPYCSGRKTNHTNCLLATCPEIANEWHPTRNNDLTSEEVTAGSHLKVWWLCPKCNSDYNTEIARRTYQGDRCPFCRGLRVNHANCLATTYPELAKQWHPTRNEGLTPNDVTAGCNKKIWWICATCKSEYVSAVNSRKQGRACPYCSKRMVNDNNCLLTTHPDLAKEWHPTRNGDLNPKHIVAGKDKKVWWLCPQCASEYDAKIYSRAQGNGCPYCRGLKVNHSNCLSTTHPEIVKEWHPTRNGGFTADKITAGSHERVWWLCHDCNKDYQTAVKSRALLKSGCPSCNVGWTLPAIRGVVFSLREHLQVFNPAELFLLFQQSGLLQMRGKGKAFVKALATGRFPKAEIDKFVNGERSLVDIFVKDPTETLQALETRDEPARTEDNLLNRADELFNGDEKEVKAELPVVQTKDVLVSLGLHVVSSADEEAIEFLLASAVAKIWKHAYRNEEAEEAAVSQAKAFSAVGYAEQVRSRFLDEFRQVKDLAIPHGYAFQIKGKPILPNLMQRHFAVRVSQQKRVGNWSGTGAGKTLAAILATRVVGSKLTIVCCPNSVVDGWRQAILEIFPDSVVCTKTFTPTWATVAGDATGFSVVADRTHRYLILNYEAFQQPDSAEQVRSLGEREPIDFIIVDEIHYAKQRTVENISLRRQLVTAFTTLAAERNPNLHVLGMSATPVINNLHEGKSMVELVSGLAHDELDTRPTLPNCMKLHQRLVTLGIRWMPDYKKMLGYECREERIAVDCAAFLDEIRALGGKSNPLKLEQILTRARLPVIRAHVKPKTLIYTYYIEGIDRLLRDALLEDGWKVGFYTGDDKTGKDAFINGDVDVLIATAAIGTGVDGLQHVCNRLILNVLPWTRAEFDQLLGRIYRQGQVSKEEVRVILPLTYAEVHGQRWSWCESKMNRLAFKKSIADAAVDGVVPEGHLRTPAQAYQDVMAWLERLETGAVEVITRPRIVVPLPETDPSDAQRRRSRYGDFSGMNRTWNHSGSQKTHERLQENPEEWAYYHTLYREARQDWAVVPYEEMIRWCQKRSGYVIGDFGCGEAKLAEAVADRHTVHSFDHVAINDNVIACDLAHVPLDDETLDLAIFSLSLMGANFADYLREAHRTLKLDGDLHIIEATSRFTNREWFVEGLKGLGFAVVSVEDKWKFTHIRALKTEGRSNQDVEVRF